MPEQDKQPKSNQDTASAKPEAGAPEGQIHVIPDQFYGAALKTSLQTKKSESESAPAAPNVKKSPIVPIVISIILLIVVGIGAYFAYLYRDTLFGAPAEPVAVAEPEPQPEPEPEPPPPPPSRPTELSATSTNPQSVTLKWTDTSDNEAAFRIERRPEEQTIYSRVSDLPPNSTAFQDNSVRASSTYYYRVIARNEQGESESSNEATVTTPPLPPPPKEVEPLPPAGLDTDSDGITDLEESLFGADPRSPDTDLDGFLDGNEVFNLYNPNGRAPAKLNEGGLTRQVSSDLGWKILIPEQWELEMNETDGSRATIKSKHGETFAISTEENPQGLSALDWYVAKNPSVDKAKLLLYRSKGGYEGIIGEDLLTTYLPWNGKIFIFKYEMNGQPFINYRTVYSMMLNSLELSGLTSKIIPAGTGQLPFEPAATKQGEITQPVSVTDATSTEGIFPEPNSQEQGDNATSTDAS